MLQIPPSAPVFKEYNENKEIELKFITTNAVKDNIIKDLNASVKKVSTLRLIDTYYISDFKDFEINGETVECVRIRKNEKGNVLTYKKIHKECNPIYCDEFETFVSNKEQMENILFALGFNVEMVIDKTRETYLLNNLELDFDSVKNLGELLEIELKDNSSDINEIYNFVKKYGLSKKDVIYEGIQNLMKKQLNKTK